jgi:Ca2+-binding RTX toxin-like protein
VKRLLVACAVLLALPASAAADTRVTVRDGRLTVVNEDAGIANRMVVEYTRRGGEDTIRLFDDTDPAGMSTFPTPPCTPGQVNGRGNPIELFCTRSAIRSISIDIGPNEDAVDYRLDQTPTDLAGGVGTDKLHSGAANDLLSGDQGNDTLESGAGNDDVRGGEGNDTINAGEGDDKVSAADGVADTVDCGPGDDSVTADHADQLVGCEHVTYQDVAAPGGPSNADDHTRPVLHAGALSSQRIGKRRRAVRVNATSSEVGSVQVTGYLVAGGVNDRLAPASASLTVAGGGVDLSLSLSRAQLRRVERDLRKGRRPKVRVTVSAVDGAGNTSATRRFWITLRR